MEIGVIGLGTDGQIVVDQLLRKTAHNLLVYDPDRRACERAVTSCQSAAELCERCDRIVITLESASDLTALFNAAAPFLREGQIFIDLTETTPALAHSIANGMRRQGAYYIDCGLFGADGLGGTFLMFAGGNSEAFAKAQPLIRCFAPDCRYLGASGRGKAGRMLCRSLAARVQECVDETAALADSFGIDGDYFLNALTAFETVADPLAALGGMAPVFSSEELEHDAALAEEMRRRIL